MRCFIVRSFFCQFVVYFSYEIFIYIQLQSLIQWILLNYVHRLKRFIVVSVYVPILVTFITIFTQENTRLFKLRNPKKLFFMYFFVRFFFQPYVSRASARLGGRLPCAARRFLSPPCAGGAGDLSRKVNLSCAQYTHTLCQQSRTLWLFSHPTFFRGNTPVNRDLSLSSSHLCLRRCLIRPTS